MTAIFSTQLFLLTLAVIGAVIIAASLLSGLLERSGFPYVAVFLLMGAILGPYGLGLLEAGVNSPLLRVLATVSLVLILFTDALSLSVPELKRKKLLSFLMIGPGTVLSTVAISFIAWRLLGLTPAMAAILGAALASTDPVLLRGLLRRPGLDPGVKQALRIESGMNDVVLLPVVLIAIALLGGGHALTGAGWSQILLSMLVLSPMAGILIGLGAVGALVLVRGKIGVRRDYESFYSIGVAFAAYAAGEAVHGSGFLAAFFAGLTISGLDVELCDCFRDYGETTAEMTLLFTFVLFGISVIWSGLTVISAATLIFAAAVFLVRTGVYSAALLPARLSIQNRTLIAWFGPRGLSSLLLVLLPEFGGVRGTEGVVAICCFVVLCSVALHGFSPVLLLPRGKQPAPIPLPNVEEKQDQVISRQPAVNKQVAEQVGKQAVLPEGDFITIDVLRSLRAAGMQPVILDERSERDSNKSDQAIPGAIRLAPDRAVAEMERVALARDTVLIAVCACPEDSTSLRVVKKLRRDGWVNARVLKDGWKSWTAAAFPVVKKA